MKEQTNLLDGIDYEAALNDDVERAESIELDQDKKTVAEERIKSRIVEPFDIFGDHTITGAQTATRDMFPWAIWDYAEDAAKRPGLNTGPIAAGCLIAVAGAIREGWRIQPKINDTEWLEPPVLWFGITGSSGAKKSSVLTAAMKPLKLIEKEMTKDIEEDQKIYLEEKAKHNELMKAWRKECAQILKDGGSKDDLPPLPVAPKPFNYQRYIVQDTTTEALLRVCADNPAGVVQERDELTEWIASFDAYSAGSGGRDRAVYLGAWNSSSVTKDRASDDKGPLVVSNFGVSIVGGIQDDIIEKDFSKSKHDGFLARFLFAKAEILKGQDCAPNAEKAKTYFDLIGKIAALNVLSSKGPGIVKMSPEAAAIREDIEALSIALNEHPSIKKGLSDHINKWPGIFSRLCLIFHMIKCVDKNKDPKTTLVQEDTAKRAYDLLTKYFLPEAARIYNDVMKGGDEQEQHARWIAGHIIAHKMEKISVYEIRRAFKSIASDDWALKKATASLELMAWITPDKKKDGKEYDRSDFSKMKWRINPRVHIMFKDQAIKEEERRRKAVEKIQSGSDALNKLKSF